MVVLDWAAEAGRRPSHHAAIAPRPGLGDAAHYRTEGPTSRRAKTKHRCSRCFFWRRLLLLALVAGIGAVASSLAERLAASASASRLPTSSCPQSSSRACLPSTYVARPGDTIWAIALRFSGSGDPQPLEYRLEQEVGGGPLEPGEVLRVP